MWHQALHGRSLAQLRIVSSAAHQPLLALPDMLRAATSPALRKGFKHHLAQTQGQAAGLERVVTALQESSNGKAGAAVQALVAESQQATDEEEPEGHDAGLIGAARRVEPSEMARNGTVATPADLLEPPDASALRRATVNKEIHTHAAWPQLARQINAEAVGPDRHLGRWNIMPVRPVLESGGARGGTACDRQ